MATTKRSRKPIVSTYPFYLIMACAPSEQSVYSVKVYRHDEIAADHLEREVCDGDPQVAVKVAYDYAVQRKEEFDLSQKALKKVMARLEG